MFMYFSRNLNAPDFWRLDEERLKEGEWRLYGTQLDAGDKNRLKKNKWMDRRVFDAREEKQQQQEQQEQGRGFQLSVTGPGTQ